LYLSKREEEEEEEERESAKDEDEDEAMMNKKYTQMDPLNANV
jgi:hypothetical protein